MARLIIIAIIIAAAEAAFLLSAAASSSSPPPGLSLSLPPFSNSTMACSFDPSIVIDMPICVPSYPTPGQYIYLCDDDQQVSARYQYRKKVRLWKKGSPFAASFSASFTFEISPEIESDNQGIFGAGLAFAITPSLSVGDSGMGSLGLFEIDPNTGRPANGSPGKQKTVAVEIDLDRDSEGWDLPPPHVGLDVNSLRSTAAAYLWDKLAGARIAAFIDYDAAARKLWVRFQNVSSNGAADRKKAKLFLAVSRFDLSRHVNERSYVGFSSRVPVTEHGVYYIREFHFSTHWVPLKKKK